MENENTFTRIKKQTLKRLSELRLYRRETYDDIINRLINDVKMKATKNGKRKST